MPLNPNLLEYGNRKAEITDFSIRDAAGNVTNVIEKDTEFQISMEVCFKEPVREPIFAYTIKDIRGTDLTGTNTMYEKSPRYGKTSGGCSARDLHPDHDASGRGIYAVPGMHRLLWRGI